MVALVANEPLFLSKVSIRSNLLREDRYTFVLTKFAKCLCEDLNGIVPIHADIVRHHGGIIPQ